MDKNQFSRDHHVIDHFWKKRLFFRDTRDHQEHDTKNRLSIPGPSPEKLMAEIHRLKENRPKSSSVCVTTCVTTCVETT